MSTYVWSMSGPPRPPLRRGTHRRPASTVAMLSQLCCTSRPKLVGSFLHHSETSSNSEAVVYAGVKSRPRPLALPSAPASQSCKETRGKHARAQDNASTQRRGRRRRRTSQREHIRTICPTRSISSTPLTAVCEENEKTTTTASLRASRSPARDSYRQRRPKRARKGEARRVPPS